MISGGEKGVSVEGYHTDIVVTSACYKGKGWQELSWPDQEGKRVGGKGSPPGNTLL